jgi:putative aminophosphonate oxidoreductase
MPMTPHPKARPGPHRSLWLAEALAHERRDDSEELEGAVRADVCIVGGGFTGMWTALRIKEVEPSRDVVLVEADICGGGASGRNGGFVMSWWSKFGSLEKMFGADEARRLARVSADSVSEIGTFCEDNGIDADYRHAGWLWVATNEAQRDAWASTIAAARSAGEDPFEAVAPEEVARLSGSNRHLAGVYERTGATVQPALLARGLRRVLRERGVRIFEHSPMTRLERWAPRVRTRKGEVLAETVVLALNAWSAQLPELRRKLVVIASDVIATPPVPERLRAIGWEEGLSISDSRRLVNYYRTTRDGRVVFGKGGGSLAFGGKVGAAFHRRSPREAEVLSQFHMIYPMLRDVGVETSWRGPIDYSLSGLPFFVRLGERSQIVVGAGFSGNGVGPSHLAGRILASISLRQDDEWAATPLATLPKGALPVEPFRHAGGRVVRAAIARKERLEDRDRHVDALAASVAKLDPTSFVDRGGSAAARRRG